MSTTDDERAGQGELAPPEGAWAAFVEAAHTMCRLAGVGLGVVHRDAAPPGLDVLHGVGALAQPERASGDIIQAIRTLGEGNPERPVDGRWRFVTWSARRVLVFADGGAGSAVADWAAGAVARFRDFERAEAALDLLGGGIVAVDGTGHVALCTPRAAELLGVSGPNEVEGRPGVEVLPHGARRLEPNEVARGTLPGRDVSFVAQQVAPRMSDAAPREGMVLRLASRSRFLEARRGQAQLLSTLRHDVRSPLTALRGLVGVLQEEPDMPAGERQALIELLRQEAERTVTWVEDYLVVLRLRFDPRPSRVVRLSPETALREIEQQYAAHARERGVVFSASVDPGAAEHRVEVDESLLETFCKNLVGHFLRLADSGASVSVQVRSDGALIVTGSGPGLFSQHPDTPFTTLARSTAAGKRTPGVGLGLFLVKKVADAHGWPIEVSARDGVVRAEVRWAVAG